MEARRQWLEARKRGIGGRDIGAIALLDPYVTPLDIYNQKLGLVEEEPQSEAAKRGLQLESTIAKTLWAGEKRIDPKRLYRPGHQARRDSPWMLCTPDFYIRGMREEGLEIKNSRFGSNYGDPETDQVPPAVLAQCMWNMAVTNRWYWHVACLIGGQELRSYYIRRCDHLHLYDHLYAIGHRFWFQHIMLANPPTTTDHLRGALDYLIAQNRIEVTEKPSTKTDWRAIAKELGASPELIAKHTKRTERIIRVPNAGNRDALETADLSAL